MGLLWVSDALHQHTFLSEGRGMLLALTVSAAGKLLS